MSERLAGQAANGRTEKWLVEKEDQGKRVDKYMSGIYQDLTRSYLQKLIKGDCITANGQIVKANYKVQAGDSLVIFLPETKDTDIAAEPISLDILYEDEDIIVVNKPKGMVVHPSHGHAAGTLVNALMYHCKEQLSGINGEGRPGIVHRIDMDTTGALVACKNDKAHQHIAGQLKDHTSTREYRAIVHGVLKADRGTVDTPIGRHHTDRKKMAAGVKNGKAAVTHYEVLERFHNYTYVKCRLETGRTHQIRVHMASIHHPLLGDQLYSSRNSKPALTGQTLHAMTLGFIHPSTEEYMEFEAPLPAYFEGLLAQLRKT